MGRSKSRGLTLIEAIFSMWIFSIVVLSVAVCVSGMNAKANQRKLQALALAKSECERVRNFITSGYLGNSDSKKYTRIFSITDKHNVKIDKLGAVVFEREDNVDPLCFDADKDDIDGKFFYTPSDLSLIPKSISDLPPGSVIGPLGFRSTLDPEELSKDFRNSAIENDGLSNLDEGKRLCKGYIVDVDIEKRAAKDESYKISFYDISIHVAWLEKDAHGKFAVRTVSFISGASSSVSVYR